MPPAVHLERELHHLPSLDGPFVRGQFMVAVRAGLLAYGRLEHGVVLYRERHVDHVDFDALLAQHPEADLAATWAQLSRREGVRHAFLILPGTPRDPAYDQGALVMQPVARGWWCALLPFRVDPGTGVPQTGNWFEFGVLGVEDLPEDLQKFTVQADAKDSAPVGPPVQSAPYMSRHLLPLREPLPVAGLPLLHALWERSLTVLRASELRTASLFCPREDALGVWHVGDPLPVPVAEIARMMVAQHPAATWVAILQAVHGDGHPRLILDLEHPEGRLRASSDLVPTDGPARFDAADAPRMQRAPPPRPGEGWVGVRPRTLFTL